MKWLRIVDPNDPQAWRAQMEDAEVVLDPYGVTDVRVIRTEPPRYEIVIDERTVSCTLAELATPAKFALRHLAVLNRLPVLPAGKGAVAKWRDTVNAWLADATVIETSPDASQEAFRRSAVAEAIENLRLGKENSKADFDRGLVIWQAGRAHIKTRPLRTRLRPEFPQMGPDDLCEDLRKLGWQEGHVRLGDGGPTKSTRSWCAPREVFASASWARLCVEGEDDADDEPEAPVADHGCGLEDDGGPMW
jgi:hypothetical protein